MPYILLKRSDVPAGVLQTLDLVPNESQRNPPYKPVGQTGYRQVPDTGSVPLTNTGGVITVTSLALGLAAWFLTNVNDGTGAASTGTVTVAAAAALDTFTITTVPAFVLTAVNAPRTPGGQDFEDAASAGSDILSADSLVAAINDDANWLAVGVTRPVVATNVGGTSAVVTLTALADGVAGDYVLASSTGVRLAVAGMAGGADADALTTAEADTNTQDVLDLLAYGDVATAAGALNLAAINGAITTGAIVAADVASILDILAGREYLVPAGVQIQAASAFGVSPAVGATGGPGFVAGSWRPIYLTGALRISFGEGRLALAASNTFTYAGILGAAVAVYNDDGSLFVG